MSTRVVKVSPGKQRALQELKDLLRQYKTIGVVTIEKVTSNAMHKMRAELRGTAVIKMAKNTLMVRAIQELKDEIPGIEGLIDYIKGPTAFICTNGNAFKIATKLDKNKLPAPAKAGAIAPNDIVIESFNTGLPPGPAISELQSVGLKTRIEQGTIKIMERAVVCRTGEKVSKTLAAVLSRLGIEPFQVGLKVNAAVEDGTLIPGDQLIIDEEQYLADLQEAARRAFALMVNAPIVTTKSMPFILSKAFSQAVALTVVSAYITKKNVPYVLSKAVSGAKALADKLAAIDPAAFPSSS